MGRTKQDNHRTKMASMTIKMENMYRKEKTNMVR